MSVEYSPCERRPLGEWFSERFRFGTALSKYESFEHEFAQCRLAFVECTCKSQIRRVRYQFEAGNGMIESVATVNSSVKVEYFFHGPHVALTSEVELFLVFEASPMCGTQNGGRNENVGIGSLVLSGES